LYSATTLSTQANLDHLVLLVEEGEVVRPQPVVAEVCVAVHVELDVRVDEGRLFRRPRRGQGQGQEAVLRSRVEQTFDQTVAATCRPAWRASHTRG
jgi:hypothetical protein